MAQDTVQVRREPAVFPTYEPCAPDRNPMFLEKRVYQGSSGRVYPLPFYNRISDTPVRRAWDAVHIENGFVRLMILPELGGRIHVGRDKINDYDFFYAQHVIKPALVGLAGPWISGGVEFNWPQHHRPATFMPVDVEIEEHPDGSKTVWLGDHDPMERMKGMHGVCLHPGSSAIELKARVYNRTPLTKTFLWWANVAVRVHEGYQSVFPPDVGWVADHARRAVSRFPLCEGRYYGVDYAARARGGVPASERPTQFVPPHCGAADEKGIPDYAPNDLSWYANIPVPTSYMCLGSTRDFSGGYDHLRKAGLVQIADHRIAPGKKQWTWGNHPFGYAWDRNLTDSDGPYVELMLGVYTDNQPDFSHLQPGETKTWSVFWYPVREIGPVREASRDAAVALDVRGGRVEIGVMATRRIAGARIEVSIAGRPFREWNGDLGPERPFRTEVALPRGTRRRQISLRLLEKSGRELLACSLEPPKRGEPPEPAAEPPEPSDVGSADELFVIGQHLAQYRHATRDPLAYWREALRRDPGDARCNHAVGLWHLRRGEFRDAESCVNRAIGRLTSRNPNPSDGEPFYSLGLALEHQGRFEEAYDAYYKAIWNDAWKSAGYFALARLDCRRGRWAVALEHLDLSLRTNADHLRARDLRVLVLRRLGRPSEADACLGETLAMDPLDWWARHLRGDELACDTQTRLDLALDYAGAGFFREALTALAGAKPEPYSGTGPMLGYARAWLHLGLGQREEALREARHAARVAPDYCFPARLEEIGILNSVLALNPADGRAAYYLGNLLYDRRRYDEAIALWERSVKRDADNATAWRNLGIAYFNVRGSASRAGRAYDRALMAAPTDARLVYERDQLWKRTGVSARARLAALEHRRRQVDERDDLSVDLCALYSQVGRPERSLALLERRRFQPWEGGEGLVLGQYVRACLALGRRALERGDAAEAVRVISKAVEPPENLGETWHLLANRSEVAYWLGEACAAAGRTPEARAWWRQAAAARGDFQDMSVKAYSEMTFHSARSMARLGSRAQARRLLEALARHAEDLGHSSAKVDYFATSLPTMLLFHDDLAARQATTALFLAAQAAFGLGDLRSARRKLGEVLRRDPSHAAAADLLTEL